MNGRWRCKGEGGSGFRIQNEKKGKEKKNENRRDAKARREGLKKREGYEKNIDKILKGVYNS